METIPKTVSIDRFTVGRSAFGKDVALFPEIADHREPNGFKKVATYQFSADEAERLARALLAKVAQLRAE